MFQDFIYNSLWSHRRANVDMCITQRDLCNPTRMSLSRVKGHADKKPWSTVSDLQSQQLSRDEIYTIWWDKLAREAW